MNPTLEQIAAEFRALLGVPEPAEERVEDNALHPEAACATPPPAPAQGGVILEGPPLRGPGTAQPARRPVRHSLGDGGSLTDGAEAVPPPKIDGEGGRPSLQENPTLTPPCAPAATASVQIADFAAKGWHLDVTVAPGQVVAAAAIADGAGFAIDAVTGVDWIAQKQIEIVYDFFHPTAPWRLVVRARIPRDEPVIETISTVFPGANWHEREAHDFFGVRFTGHPDLSPFLLPDDATYHPLRKDFTA